MHKLTVPLLLLFICFFYLPTQAQQKTDNTLLWRISGNGLKEPSYLYGTIHITDKRVFHLGDSVHAAIQNTKGLAAELDMITLTNEVIAGFINEYEGDDDVEAPKEVLLKNILEKEIWDKYKTKLEKRLKIKADKITLSDIKRVKQTNKEKLYKKGEMPTFLDAWLMGLAKKNNKWVGGIEDLVDQEEHIGNRSTEEIIEDILYDDKYASFQLDWMINQYLQQRLDAIDSLYNQSFKEKDLIMIKRNKKMAYRMDSLAAVRSTFFAVGVAHLPGEEGVISLLQDKGFTVTPVFSKNKVKVEDISIVNPDNYWQTKSYIDGVYSLKMPGEPIKINKGIGKLVDMHVYFDLTGSKGYMSLQIPIHDEKKGEAIERIFKGMNNPSNTINKVVSKKSVTILGMPAIEYQMTNANWTMKGQVIELAEKMVILNGVITLDSDNLKDTDVDYYFKSFAYNKEKLAAFHSDNNWKTLEHDGLSFSVSMLENAKSDFNAHDDADRSEHSWAAFDAKKQIYYGMHALVLKKGYYHSANDTTYLLGMKDNLKSMFDKVELTDSSFSRLNGSTVFTTTLSGLAKNEYLTIQCKFVLRGGILYYLFTTYEPGSENEILSNHYINSFRLLPYKYKNWQLHKSKTGSFSYNSPALMEERITELENQSADELPMIEAYNVYDSITGYTINIDKTIIPYWYWISSDTAFLRKRMNNYTGWSDSVINYRVTQVGNKQQATFFIKQEETMIVKKVKMVINGNELYELYSYVSATDTLNDVINYDKNFTILNELKPVERKVSKISVLKELLKNATADELNGIKLWMRNIDFDKSDLPVLYEMALTAYSDLDSNYYSSINKLLFDKIETLDTATTMVNIIAGKYENLKDKNEVLKPYLLKYLSNIKTADSYNNLKNLLLSDASLFDNENEIYLSLNDSLSLTASLYPDVLDALTNKNLWSGIIYSLNNLLDKDAIDIATIAPHKEKLISLANKVLKEDPDKIEEDVYTYVSLIEVLSFLKDETANKAIKDFLVFDNIQIRFAIVKALLKNNQAVDVKEIAALANDDYYLYDLYEFLALQEKLQLLPAKYQDRKMLAKSKLHTLLVDEEDYTPKKIAFVTEKVTRFKNEEKRFLLFAVSFEAEDDNGNSTTEDYLAVVGPYSIKGKELIIKNEATGVIWSEIYSKTNLNNLFSKYIVKLEEDDE